MFTLFFILFLVLLLASVIGALVFKIVTQSINRTGELGINLSRLHCPRCGEKAVLLRTPNLIKQAPWGGGACANCACEMDKWGNEISTLSEKEQFAKQLEQMKITPIPIYDEFGKTRLEKVFEDNDK
jgi:hypothetical protein